MKFINLTVSAGIIFLLSVFVCNAQVAPSAENLTTAGFENISSANRPPVTESWTLIVETSGGFTGRKRNAFRLTSNVKPISYLKEEIPLQQLSADELTLLSEKVWAAKSSGKTPDNTNLCLDCIVTTLRIFRTTRTGITEIQTFVWDSAIYNSIPEDIKNIFENIPVTEKTK